MEILEELLAASPDAPDLLFRRGEVLRHQREWGRAMADFDRAIALSNDFHAVRLSQARVAFHRGDSETSQARLNGYFKVQPKHWEGHQLQAEIHIAASNFVAAAASYRQVLALHPRPEPGHYLNIVNNLELAGGTENKHAGLESLNEGIKQLGPLPVLLLAKVELAASAGQLAPSLATMEEVIQRYGSNPRWETRRGELLLGLGRKADARRTLQQAVRAIQTLPTRRRDTVAHKLLLKQIHHHLETIDP